MSVYLPISIPHSPRLFLLPSLSAPPSLSSFFLFSPRACSGNTEGRKAESGVRLLPPPHQLGSLGSAVSSQWVRGGTRPPKGFPLFSAFRMASPDTIVNCGLSRSHWGQAPRAPPLAYASLSPFLFPPYSPLPFLPPFFLPIVSVSVALSLSLSVCLSVLIVCDLHADLVVCRSQRVVARQ